MAMNGSDPSDKFVIGQEAAEASTITSDSELEDALTSVDGEINDALNALEEKDYGDALEAIAKVQEAINEAHTYLSGKVE